MADFTWQNVTGRPIPDYQGTQLQNIMGNQINDAAFKSLANIFDTLNNQRTRNYSNDLIANISKANTTQDIDNFLNNAQSQGILKYVDPSALEKTLRAKSDIINRDNVQANTQSTQLGTAIKGNQFQDTNSYNSAMAKAAQLERDGNIAEAQRIRDNANQTYTSASTLGNPQLSSGYISSDRANLYRQMSQQDLAVIEALDKDNQFQQQASTIVQTQSDQQNIDKILDDNLQKAGIRNPELRKNYITQLTDRYMPQTGNALSYIPDDNTTTIPISNGVPVNSTANYRLAQPGEQRENADGTHSTELLTTWQLPDGKWVNVPSLVIDNNTGQWKEFSPDDQDGILGFMNDYEKNNGQSFIRYDNLQEAENAAKERSANEGANNGPQIVNTTNNTSEPIDSRTQRYKENPMNISSEISQKETALDSSRKLTTADPAVQYLLSLTKGDQSQDLIDAKKTYAGRFLELNPSSSPNSTGKGGSLDAQIEAAFQRDVNNVYHRWQRKAAAEGIKPPTREQAKHIVAYGLKDNGNLWTSYMDRKGIISPIFTSDPRQLLSNSAVDALINQVTSSVGPNIKERADKLINLSKNDQNILTKAKNVYTTAQEAFNSTNIPIDYNTNPIAKKKYDALRDKVVKAAAYYGNQLDKLNDQYGEYSLLGSTGTNTNNSTTNTPTDPLEQTRKPTTGKINFDEVFKDEDLSKNERSKLEDRIKKEYNKDNTLRDAEKNYLNKLIENIRDNLKPSDNSKLTDSDIFNRVLNSNNIIRLGSALSNKAIKEALQKGIRLNNKSNTPTEDAKDILKSLLNN